MLRPYAVPTSLPPRRRQRRAVELATRAARQLGDRFQYRGDHIGGELFPQMESQAPLVHPGALLGHPRAPEPPPPPPPPHPPHPPRRGPPPPTPPQHHPALRH